MKSSHIRHDNSGAASILMAVLGGIAGVLVIHILALVDAL